MKVLAVASELYPLVKTGGLADVAGALPLALAAHGVGVVSLLPGYPAVKAAIGKGNRVAHFPSLLGVRADLIRARAGELDLLVLDAPELYDRPDGPYGDRAGADYPDNWRRFAAFSLAAAHVARGAVAGYLPDLVHAHDWQAAMTLAYLRYGDAPAPPGILTIHNLAFQGRFAASVFAELGLPARAWSLDGVEYYSGVGYLKAGLQAARAITTVSPTYAREIRAAEFGMGLDGLLNARAGDLHGIVNGIDTGVWNPAADLALADTFGPRTLHRRAANRRALEERFALARDNAPLFAVVSRLTWQKGMDVLADSVDAIVAQGAKLAVLGSGDAAIEARLLAAAGRHAGRVGAIAGYDEGLSHLMQGGADAILVPSRFEPCGLTQLCAMRYGCIPVVARTGGLADTVVDANDAAVAAGVATGILFSPLTRGELLHAIGRATALRAQPKTWAAMQRNAMKADVSWQASAARYAELFRSLAARN